MMRRRITAITLLVSFVAMATSGLLMIVVDKPSFTIQMHPVHKLFGLLLIGAALSHIQLNARAIGAHLKEHSAAIAAAVLTAALALTYALVALNPIPPDIAEPLDKAAQQAENRDAAAR
jgi:hypothetical protein